MKALTFIKFYDLTPKEKRDFLGSIGKIQVNDYKTRFDYEDSEPFFIGLYHNIISQPFKPEMIIELFENWELTTNHTIGECYHYTPDKRYGYIKFRNDFIQLYADYATTIPIPKTLNDFISDCQRTGFELFFKVNP